MIAIVNVGPFNQSPFGEREYEVRINSQLITKFKHERKDGLAACLMAAAKAVEKKKWEDMAEKLFKPPPLPDKEHENNTHTTTATTASP